MATIKEEYTIRIADMMDGETPLPDVEVMVQQGHINIAQSGSEPTMILDENRAQLRAALNAISQVEFIVAEIRVGDFIRVLRRELIIKVKVGNIQVSVDVGGAMALAVAFDRVEDFAEIGGPI